jgi:dipeptidyl aminopeptidase/acylaminoacyl peptidase
MPKTKDKVMRKIERDDFYTLKMVGDVAITADGAKVAYVVRAIDKDKDDYVSNIHVWEAGECRQYTFSGKDSSPRWSPDGKWLALISGRDERAQLFLLPTSGGEAKQLTKLPMGAGEPVWAPDSESIAFAGMVQFPKEDDPEDGTSGDSKDKAKGPEAKTKIIDRAVFKFDGAGFNHDRRMHIFTVQVSDGEVTQLTDGDCNNRSPAWSPDSRHIVFTANRSENWDTRRGSDIWIVPADGGEPRALTDGDGGWYDPVYSPDGRQIAYVGFPIQEGTTPTYFPQVWVTDRAGKSHTNLMTGQDQDVGHSVGSDWAIGGRTGLTWLSSGIYFISSVRAGCQLFRLSTKGMLKAITQGERDVSSYGISDNGASIAYASSDPTHPAEVFLRTNRTEKRLTNENENVLSGLRLAPYERLTAAGAGRQEVEGWVLKPFDFDDTKSYPLLLYIHGGPATAYGHSFFQELQWWAGQGYGVAICNPHGSSSYGCDWMNSIRHDWGNKDYKDIMAFADAAAALPWVDETRMAAAGGSYGGFMVNWLAGHTDRFAAFCTQRSICNIVSQGGTSDFAAFRQDTSGGTPEGNPEKLWNQSPLKFASNVKTPTLILHQEQDHRCPIEQGEQWFTALKRMGVTARFIRFPQESHGMSRTGKPSRRYERLGHMHDWFGRFV